MSSATIAVLGTFDSKGPEHDFVAAAIRRAGFATLLIDVGSLDAPTLGPDITRAEVLSALGEDVAAILARRDRGEWALAERAALRLLRAGLSGGGSALGTGGDATMREVAELLEEVRAEREAMEERRAGRGGGGGGGGSAMM